MAAPSEYFVVVSCTVLIGLQGVTEGRTDALATSNIYTFLFTQKVAIQQYCAHKKEKKRQKKTYDTKKQCPGMIIHATLCNVVVGKNRNQFKF